MNRTLRIALLLAVVACAMAASAPSLITSEAASVGSSAARRSQTSARASARRTPQTSNTPQSSATPQRDERLWKRALAIHRRAIIVDGHNDIPTIMVDENYDLGTPSAGKYHTDLQRLKQSGMTGEFFSIYVD